MGIKSDLLKTVVKKKKAAKTEYEKAHAIAQRNASLPIEQGGLGLPPDNTAMDRARAMGFDVENPMYHGTVDDFYKIDLSNVKKRFPFSFGFHSTNSPSEASAYADSIQNAAENFNPNSKFTIPVADGANVLPLLVNKGDNPLLRSTNYVSASMDADLNKSDIIKKLYDAKKSENKFSSVAIDANNGNANIVSLDPSNIRSRFAAFDPLKRNSSNILASAGAGAAVAGGALYTPEENQAQAGVVSKSVSELAQRLKGIEGVKTLNLYETSNGDIKLDTLIIDKDKRNSGIGSNVMQEINAFADENGKRVLLTPAVKDDFQGTTSRGRLVKYYKRHGFVENKGRNKDFSISEGMIREPQKGATTAQGVGTLAALSSGAAAIYDAAKNDKLGEAINYAQDAANMIGYIPSVGLLTTSDIIGGVAKAGAAATGNLDAYNENIAPYIERAGETKSGLGKAVEGVIGYGVEQAAPYVAQAVAPIVDNVQSQWQRIEDTPGDANVLGFMQELKRKADAKLFQSQAQIDAYNAKRNARRSRKQTKQEAIMGCGKKKKPVKK